MVSGNTTAKKRVLLVDDEPQIGKIFGLKLKLSGYDVVATTKGTEAVELLRTQKFDILLLDILMPDMSGLEVLGRVRAFSRIPVIMFSAKENLMELAKKAGANEFISKPLDPDHLVEKVRLLLDKTNGKKALA